MYHSISDSIEPGIAPYYRVCTSPKRFAEHMQWLADAGYRGVTLAEGLAILDGELRSDTRPVVITFDDGLEDLYTRAYQILDRHEFSATAYVPTGYIARSPMSLHSRRCMTWAQVLDLSQCGIEFGSHTVAHPVLYRLSWEEIAKEIAVSRDVIEQKLGRKANAFAYPYAFPQHDTAFATRFVTELDSYGYTSCVTTMLGRVRVGDNRLLLKRLPVNTDDDCELLLAKLSGAYDWLAAPQQALKTITRPFKRAREIAWRA